MYMLNSVGERKPACGTPVLNDIFVNIEYNIFNVNKNDIMAFVWVLYCFFLLP